jgi:hypothetical protein
LAVVGLVVAAVSVLAPWDAKEVTATVVVAVAAIAAVETACWKYDDVVVVITTRYCMEMSAVVVEAAVPDDAVGDALVGDSVAVVAPWAVLLLAEPDDDDVGNATVVEAVMGAADVVDSTAAMVVAEQRNANVEHSATTMKNANELQHLVVVVVASEVAVGDTKHAKY